VALDELIQFVEATLGIEGIAEPSYNANAFGTGELTKTLTDIEWAPFAFNHQAQSPHNVIHRYVSLAFGKQR
jgi:hypothetical protein